MPDLAGLTGEAAGLPVEERVSPSELLREIRSAASREGPEFWARESRRYLRWRRPFTRALDWDPPFARWFPDGELNAAECCLPDSPPHVPPERVAYHWEGEDGEHRTIRYGDLSREVERWASALHRRGFGPSDVAVIYLPMVPELPIAMLAMARLGIPFSVVFSGFSAAALRERIDGLGARLVITADGGYRRGRVVPLREQVDRALSGSPARPTVVVVPRLGPDDGRSPVGDVGLGEFLEGSGPRAPLPAFPSDHPLFFLYSSGTTGRPKAIVHGTGGYLAHVAATFRWVFDAAPEDVFWCAADVGWVAGHSYIVFGPLLHGVTGVLYEGAFDTPGPERLWRMIDEYRVSVLYTSPTLLRSLRKSDPEPRQHHRLDSLRLLGTVGESINPSVWRWYFDAVGVRRCPIIDSWWQTETGGIMVSPVPGLGLVPLKPGSATLPVPGVDVEVVGDDGAPAPPGVRGWVVVRKPWPGMLLGLRGDPERYASTYWSRFPGVYYTGDYGLRDSDGYLWFLGRADEVLKVAGHRLGTIEIEDALLGDPSVAEAAVCGRPDEVRGEVPVAFVVLRPGFGADPSRADGLRRRVEEELGGLARPAEVLFVRGLPKTRSGKILRRVVRAVAEGRESVGDTTTLEDEAPVEEVLQAFRALRRDLTGSEGG